MTRTRPSIFQRTTRAQRDRYRAAQAAYRERERKLRLVMEARGWKHDRALGCFVPRVGP